jgi:general secretion pathway protein H
MTAKLRNRGFTLIEILVVVIIVATISSMALLSLGLIGDDRELDTERRRLATLLELAQDEAAMQGREFGLELLQSGYRFVEFDPFAARWDALQHDDLLRLRKLPEGMELELYLEDQRVMLNTDPRKLQKPDDDNAMRTTADEYTPHLYLSSSGESTAYEIRLRRPANDQELVMRGDILGNIELDESDD